jgi:hypothetical protein
MTNEPADRKGRVYPIIQEKQVFLEKKIAVKTLSAERPLGKCYCCGGVISEPMQWLMES